MTRKSKREIQRAVNDLDPTPRERDCAVVYQDPETEDYIDLAGAVVDPETVLRLVVVPTDDQIAAKLEELDT
jgi:hypothetical protein